MNYTLYIIKYMNDKTSLREVVKQVIKDINQDGLDVICNSINGNFSFLAYSNVPSDPSLI